MESFLVDVTSVLAFLGVMQASKASSLLYKPNKQSKAATLVILLPGIRFRRLKEV